MHDCELVQWRDRMFGQQRSPYLTRDDHSWSSNLRYLFLVVSLAAMGLGEIAWPMGPGNDHRILDRFAGRGCALSIDSVYTGEVFHNARGGIRTKDATRYQGLLDIGLTFRLEQADLPIPGRVFLLAQNTHGRGLTEDVVGDTQVLSNIDSFENVMQVSEYWWELGLLDDDIVVRLGKQDVNTEFLFVDTAADFIQSTFGLSPSTAFPTFPDPSMGAVVLLRVSDAWQLKAGVWDAFAEGTSWGFSGNDSLLLAVELERKYALAGGTLPGTLAIGAVYEGRGEIDGQPVSPVHEYVIQLEQVLFREHPHCAGDRQGLAVFGGYYPRFPGNQIVAESIGDSFIVGLVYTGLIAGRDDDVMGAGVAWTELFLGGSNEETVTEIFYKMQLSQRVSVQPDLQHIATPSGIFRDSLAVGLRFQVTL